MAGGGGEGTSFILKRCFGSCDEGAKGKMPVRDAQDVKSNTRATAAR